MKAMQKIFPNKLRLVTVPMPDAPTVTVLVMVAAGTRYETRATNGLSHFLEHMCFKGTKKRGARQIAQELEAMGAQTNAFTSYDYTGYYAKGRAQLFKRLLDVVADVYQNSVFPKEEIEKERGVICGEIDMYEDMPQRKVAEMFNESLYGDQPAGYTVLGPKSNIRRFTQKDFLRYRDRHYVAGKTTIVVVGNVIHEEAVHEVQSAFSSIRTGVAIPKKKITPAIGKKIYVKSKKTDQSHLVMGVRGIPAGHPDHSAFEVMTGLLGQGMSSRLFLKLREEMGAGYYVRASQWGSDDAGEFEIRTGTEPKRVQEVVRAIAAEIVRLRKEPIPHDELLKTHEYLVGSTYMGLEATDDIAFHIGHQAIAGQPYKLPQDIEQEIRKVTKDDIQRVAQKYLVPSRIHLALIGPHTPSAALRTVLAAAT